MWGFPWSQFSLKLAENHFISTSNHFPTSSTLSRAPHDYPLLNQKIHCYFSSEKHLEMAMFNSYVKLPVI